jgi:hypothetical protein
MCAALHTFPLYNNDSALLYEEKGYNPLPAIDILTYIEYTLPTHKNALFWLCLSHFIL